MVKQFFKIVSLILSGTIIAAGAGISTAALVDKNKETTKFSYAEHKHGDNTKTLMDRDEFLSMISNSPSPNEYLSNTNIVEKPYSFTLQMDKCLSEYSFRTEINYTYYPNKLYVHYQGSGDIYEYFGLHYDLVDFEMIISQEETLFRLCRFVNYINDRDLSNPMNKMGYTADQALLATMKKWISFDVKEVHEPEENTVESATRYYQEMLATDSFKLVESVQTTLSIPKFMSLATTQGIDSGFLKKSDTSDYYSYSSSFSGGYSTANGNSDTLLREVNATLERISDNTYVLKYGFGKSYNEVTSYFYTQTINHYIPNPHFHYGNNNPSYDSSEGTLYLNTKENKLYYYENEQWNDVAINDPKDRIINCYLSSIDSTDRNIFATLLESMKLNHRSYYSYSFSSRNYISFVCENYSEQENAYKYEEEKNNSHPRAIYMLFLDAYDDISFEYPEYDYLLSELYYDAAHEYAEYVISHLEGN